MMGAAHSDGALERRAFVEFRADVSARKLEGYAATFGAQAEIGAIVETIAPGAFRAALGGDILALMDQDATRVLGRTASGTLRLSEDARGLKFSLDLPDTAPGRDVLELATRGDLGGMSFGFLVPPNGDEWEGRNRTLRAVNLMEISVVSAWPAYPDTSLALRHSPLSAISEMRARRQRQIQMAEAGL
jgi:uncharacterized protein